MQHTMRRVHFKGFLLGTLLSVTTLAVRADDWAGPQTKEVFSASREYFVRVIPGESLGDTFGFAREKKGKYAAAEFYRRHQDRSYRLLAEGLRPKCFFNSLEERSRLHQTRSKDAVDHRQERRRFSFRVGNRAFQVL
jgi:hypothetical protein